MKTSINNLESAGPMQPIALRFPGVLGRAGSRSRQMDWLPVPRDEGRRKAAPAPSAAGIARLLNGLRMERDVRSVAEPVLMLILAAGAAGAIACGFSKLIDLVEHWAIINSAVERLLS